MAGARKTFGRASGYDRGDEGAFAEMSSSIAVLQQQLAAAKAREWSTASTRPGLLGLFNSIKKAGEKSGGGFLGGGGGGGSLKDIMESHGTTISRAQAAFTRLKEAPAEVVVDARIKASRKTEAPIRRRRARARTRARVSGNLHNLQGCLNCVSTRYFGRTQDHVFDLRARRADRRRAAGCRLLTNLVSLLTWLQ